jgi:ABC-type dipeptide/oligopeptide/nickel transport system permease component
VIGIPTGIVSAIKRNTVWDNASMVAAIAGVSTPGFWLGLMLMLLFSVRLGWLPTSGAGSFRHLILPATALGLGSAAMVARQTRSAMLDVLGQDYVRTARAKGLREQTVILRHALKNAMIPVVTIVGLQMGTMLGGSVIIEMVFAWPGMGRILVQSISYRDFPMIQSCILLLAAGFVLVNLIVDVLYVYIDPRIRYN